MGIMIAVLFLIEATTIINDFRQLDKSEVVADIEKWIILRLANAYYREGEDENTPQEEVDSFIRIMFEKVMNREIEGCFAKAESTYIGFSLWTIDTEEFEFSELPGCGTILEIGLIASYRSSGLGREFVFFIEKSLRRKNVKQCYVSAYGPVQKFWSHCGYADNGKKASNGLPIMVKTIC